MRTKELPQNKDVRLRIKYILTCCALVLFFGLLIVIPANTVYAADAALLDENAQGSISITMISEDGERVSGGILTAYKVAQLDKNGDVLSYSPTEEFADSGIDIRQVTADLNDSQLAELAFKLETYAKDTDVIGQEMTIGSEGDACLTQVSLGLYLISQTQAADGWTAIDPFLISVPYDDEDGWIYDVDALPKMKPISGLEQIQVSDEEDTEDAEEIEEVKEAEEEQAVTTRTSQVQASPEDQSEGQSTQPATLSEGSTSTDTPSTGKTSGTKLAQTGDGFFDWLVKNWMWLALGCAGCIAVIITVLLHQRHRMNLI